MSSSAVHLGTSSCFRQFAAVQQRLQTADSDLAAQVPATALEDEVGRFRLWAANIGALSKGHSSLDYRLRDAPLVHEGVLKLLNELLQELYQMTLVLSGSRLPYEAQPRHVNLMIPVDSDSSSSDSESSSNSSSESDSDISPPNELYRRLSALSDINDNLYGLSRYIRAPALHTRSLNALAFKDVDKETGIDLVQQFSVIDLDFTEELFMQLRRNAQGKSGTYQELNDAELALIKRFAHGITRRRQLFLYWRSHRKKLGAQADNIIRKNAPGTPEKGGQTVPVPIKGLQTGGRAMTESSKPRTTFTETTATLYIPPIPTPDDGLSTTSFATTTRGLDGSRVELPKLPKHIKQGKDFECPYCQIMCPSKYQTPRAWRTHLLRDLRPYICTYNNCSQSDELFATREDWQNHELSFHQTLWQCPEHSSMSFSTPEGLKAHLQSEAHTCTSRISVEDLLAICATISPDSRTTCLICLAETVSSNELTKHLANHLERFAAFALPRGIDTGTDEESSSGSEKSRIAIARSDYSGVSEKFQPLSGNDIRLEAEASLEKARLLRSKLATTGRALDSFTNSSGDDENPLNEVCNIMERTARLPAEVFDKLMDDDRLTITFSAICDMLAHLANNFDHPDIGDWQELALQLRWSVSSFAEVLEGFIELNPSLDSPADARQGIMSSAEAIAVLGVISSVIAIVELIKVVYDTVKAKEDLPEAFSVVADRLLTVTEILHSARLHLDGDEDSCKGVQDIIFDCDKKAKTLNNLFQKVIPKSGASNLKRYYKAVKAYGKGNEVENLMKGILEDVQLLAYRNDKIATKVQQEQIVKAIKEVSDVTPSVPEHEFQETGFTANYSGSGTQNNPQGEYIAQGEARQYNSAVAR